MREVDKLAKMIRVTWMVVGFVVIIFFGYTTINPAPYDDTDNGEIRSGLALKTDHGTGCEYLVIKGAITPRLSENGKPICGEEGD